MIGFGNFLMSIGQAFHDLAHVKKAASQAHALLNLTSINQQANAVAGVKRDLGKRKSGVDGKIELGQFAYAGAQQPAGIDDQPDGLASFHLKEPADQLSPPGCRCPADIAELITLAIFAKTLEFAAHAPLAYQPFFQLDLTGTVEENVLAPGFFQIGEYADGLFQGGFGPAFRKTGGALVAQVNVTRLDIATL